MPNLPRVVRTAGCFALVLCGFSLFIAPPANAALSVSPTRIVHQGTPRQTLHGQFAIENHGEDVLEVSVQPEDWARGLSGPRGPVPWLTVRPTHVTLKPGKRARVNYTIRIPNDASGELRSQIFFTTGGAGTMSPRTRLGTIIYVGIKGTEQVEAAIGKVDAFYTVETPGAEQPDRLDIAMRIHNRSNVHIVPEGEVLIRDAQGRQVASVLMPAGWGLLPHEEDLYHAIGHGIFLQPGRYTLDIRVRCGHDLEHPILMTKTLESTLGPKGQLKLIEPQTPPTGSLTP